MNFDEEDKFILSKSNIVLIVISSILLITTIIISVFLFKSLSNEVKPLPDLETTQGRTSTVSSRTTTSETTTTVKTTIPPSSSPYYTVNISDILSEDILTKQDITKEEAQQILTILFNFANKFYNMGDDSLFNISNVIKYAKDNETDKIEFKGNKYGEIYNGTAIIEKAFIKRFHYLVTNNSYKRAAVIYKNGDKYYRLENQLSNFEVVFASISIDKFESDYIKSNIRYYLSNYEEEGYTSPVYKSIPLEICYENGRWKIKSYVFPLYK